MSKKKTETPIVLWVLVVGSFLLAFMDMLFLGQALAELTRNTNFALNTGAANIAAFALATVANLTALMWGVTNGRTLAKKTINKESRSWFISWVILGLVYAGIRVASMALAMNSGEGDAVQNILGQIVIMAILAVSYIGSGTAIQWAARQIFDADVKEYQEAKKKFTEAHKKISHRKAALQEVINVLDDYDQNLVSLDRQYDKIKMAIMKSEKAVMAEIVGKTVTQNPEIDPVKAGEVMEEVLAERKKENEKLHAEQE